MQTRKQKIEREIDIFLWKGYASLLIDAKKKALLPLSLKKVSFQRHLKEKNTA